MPGKSKSTKIDSDAVKSLRDSKCNVYYQKEIKKNLGNYENVTITVGVTLPVNPTEKELEAIRKTIEIGDLITTEELELQIKELATEEDD